MCINCEWFYKVTGRGGKEARRIGLYSHEPNPDKHTGKEEQWHPRQLSLFLGRGVFCFFRLLNDRHSLVHVQGMRSFGWGPEMVLQHHQGARRNCFNLIQREKPLFLIQIQSPVLSPPHFVCFQSPTLFLIHL